MNGATFRRELGGDIENGTRVVRRVFVQGRDVGVCGTKCAARSRALFVIRAMRKQQIRINGATHTPPKTKRQRAIEARNRRIAQAKRDYEHEIEKRRRRDELAADHQQEKQTIGHVQTQERSRFVNRRSRVFGMMAGVAAMLGMGGRGKGR